MFADYHMHTYFSYDSDYPMEELIKDAIGLGLDEICITEHVELDIKEDWPDGSMDYDPALKAGQPERNVMYNAYYAALAAMKEKYRDRISIKEGIEFGIQSHNVDKYRQLYASHPFDFVINSSHQVDDLEFWTGDYQRGKTRRQFNRGYYEDILKVVRTYKDYSVLGHLDSIVRYDDEGPIAFCEISDIVESILKQVIADGRGIEVNTSCFRYGLPDLTPSTDILRMYLELGGEILTLGSDTHGPGQIACRFPEVKDRLKALGYRYFCTFDRMVPAFHPL